MTRSLHLDPVTKYLLSLPQPAQDKAWNLREMILSTLPQIEEKLSYKIPFYYYYGPLCYINYGKEGLYLGLYRGIQLMHLFSQLEQKERVQVASLALSGKNNVDDQEIKSILTEAAAMNQRLKTKTL